MTDEHITNALAEKVMGFSFTVDDKGSVWRQDVIPYSIGDNLFRPLTSDSDACAVLDKMAETHHAFDMQYNVRGKMWYASFERCEYLEEDQTWVFAGPDVEQFDTDRRRAICIAALKAVGAWEE